MSTIDQLCNVVCPTCWRVRVNLEYTCDENTQCCDGTPQPATKVKDCGTSELCANDYMSKPYLKLNSTSLCFYDPTRCDQVEFEKGYTWWYWFIWAFPTITLICLMNYWTYYALNKWLDDQKKALMGYLLIWWVIFFPLIFLLPLGVATKPDQVSSGGKTAVLTLAFVIMAISLGVMAFLWYQLKKGGSNSGMFPGMFGTSPTSNAALETKMQVQPAYAEGGEPTSGQNYAKM